MAYNSGGIFSKPKIATPKPQVAAKTPGIFSGIPKPAVKPVTPAAPSKPIASNGFMVSFADKMKQEVANKKENDATEALNAAAPRAQAARMMKRQAGIGQLKTMHKPEAEL